MAKMNSSKANELTGVLGEVVFTHWKGKPIVKSKPRKPSRPPSARQLFQRARMQAVMDFLRSYRPVVNKYFDIQPPDTTLHNLSNSYYLSHVLRVEGEQLSIEIDKVILTKGGLRGLEEASCSLSPDGTLQLEWNPLPPEAGSHPDDLLYIAVYAPDLHSGELFPSVAHRKGGQGAIMLPTAYTNTAVHFWAGFIAHDQSQASWSCYLEV